MAGAIYGQGFVTLEPKLSTGFDTVIRSQMRSVTPAMARAGRDAGQAFGAEFEQNVRDDISRVGDFAKKGALAIGAIGTAIAALAIKGGISRALNIEDAQAKLRGLGHDVESVETIMESALDSVRGTAFGLDAAATAAASAVAAGIEPGEDLTRVLGLTGDAATIMGRSFEESGSIVNKILASNRVSMEEVNQLHDAGLPILSQLADQYGVNAVEMREMVSQGVVDSERFLDALETNIGGAALESGETTRGALANVGAALSRLGATVVSSFLPVTRDAFSGLIEGVDDLTGRVKPAMEEFANSDFFAAIEEHITRIPEYVETGIEAFGTLADVAGPVLGELGTAIAGLATIATSDFGKIAAAILGVKTALDLVSAHPLILLATTAGWVAGQIKEHVDEIQAPINDMKDTFEELPEAIKADVFRAAIEEAWGPEAVERLEIFLERSGASIEDFSGTTEGAAHLIEIAGQDIGETWDVVGEKVDENANWVIDNIKAMGPEWEGSGSSAGEFEVQMDQVADALGNVAGLSSVAGAATEEIGEDLDELRAIHADTFEEMTASIDGYITGFEELPERADITMDEFVTNLTERTTAIATFYDNLLVLSSAGFDALVADLSEKGPEAAAGLAEDFADNIFTAKTANDAIVASTSLGTAAVGALVTSEIINDAIQSGKDIASGVASGINLNAHLVSIAASSMINTALQGVREEIQALSPSRKFADLVGLPIAQGVALGISDGSSEATTALNQMIADLSGSPSIDISSRFEGNLTGGGPSGLTIQEGAIQLFNPVPETAVESLAGPALAVSVGAYLR